MSYFQGIKIIDTAGTAQAIKFVDGKPRMSNTPYDYDVAEGNLAGHKTWSKIGFASGVGTAEIDVAPWCTGPYVFPTTELAMTLVSAATADSTTGGGARTVIVYYLNASFVEQSATITLNQTTAVSVATDMYRINNMRVASVGSSGAPAGALVLAASGVTYGYISAGRTRQRQCVWTVPASNTLYITQIAFSAGDQNPAKNGGVRFTTRANYDDKSGAVLQRGLFMPFNEVILYNSAYDRTLVPPTKLPATTDLKVSAIGLVSDTADVTVTLRGWTET
jgi:hypothetical protein